MGGYSYNFSQAIIMLRKHGLSTDGLKSELQAHLMTHLADTLTSV
jgi:hypothetical protein